MNKWQNDSYIVITWLINICEPFMSVDIMFLSMVKDIWDALKDMYGHEKNISHVYVLYKYMFNLHQDRCFVNDYFVVVIGKLDELTVNHPIAMDATILKQ